MPVPAPTASIEPSVTVTGAGRTWQLSSAAELANLAEEVALPAVNAQLHVSTDGQILVRAARDGRVLDLEPSRQRFERALAEGERSTTIVLNRVAPFRSDADIQALRQRIERALETPLVATFEDQQLPLTRADIAPLLSIRGSTLGVDAQAADALARLLAAELHRPAVNARFDWNAGKLETLRPSAAGRDLDITLAAQRLTSALVNGASSVALPVYRVDPAVSSEDPPALGIDELIERGSTSFAGSVPEKKANITLAAQRLHGVVVPPQGTFSFNDEVGPTTLESGFQWGFGIESGTDGPKTVPSVAGGICQVATTLFQPVFWAGYTLEERYAHGYWIPSYASRGVVGLDVTVDGDANLDFRWSNPTDDYVLVQSSIEGDTVRFALYGKKPQWQVEVARAVVSNERPSDPTPLHEQDAHLPTGHSLQVSAARDGFDVQVTRVVSPLDGGEARALRVATSYQPSRTVTLVGIG